MHACVPHACLVPMELRKGYQTTLNWRYRWTMCILGTKPSSARATVLFAAESSLQLTFKVGERLISTFRANELYWIFLFSLQDWLVHQKESDTDLAHIPQ